MLVIPERRDDTAGGGQLDEDHHQHDHNGDYRAVDEQQHHDNHDERDHGDFRDAFLTRMGLIGKQRSRPGDVGLDPRRRRHRVHDLADGLARLGGLAAAHVAGEVHLNVCGFLVVALGARGGQGITPEVLDVLNVFLVLLESLDDLVVVAVGLRPQRFVALQQDHRRAVGTELFERRPDAHHRLERHRVFGTLRHRVGFGDDLQLR